MHVEIDVSSLCGDCQGGDGRNCIYTRSGMHILLYVISSDYESMMSYDMTANDKCEFGQRTCDCKTIGITAS